MDERQRMYILTLIAAELGTRTIYGVFGSEMAARHYAETDAQKPLTWERHGYACHRAILFKSDAILGGVEWRVESADYEPEHPEATP